jgi:hypothetical protein
LKALLGICLGLALALGGAWEERKAMASRRWPTVDGTVVQSRLVSRRGWRADVSYAYTVAGAQYRNDSTSLDVFSSERAQVAQYPTGTRVTVHYDPADPATSILEPGGHRGLVGILGGLFVIAHWVKRHRAARP